MLLPLTAPTPRALGFDPTGVIWGIEGTLDVHRCLNPPSSVADSKSLFCLVNSPMIVTMVIYRVYGVSIVIEE